MGKQIMICGVDCRMGDANCNGYCMNKAPCAADATEAMIVARAHREAHAALDAAEKAWYDYAGLLEVGAFRVNAFEVYDKIRCARRKG